MSQHPLTAFFRNRKTAWRLQPKKLCMPGLPQIASRPICCSGNLPGGSVFGKRLGNSTGFPRAVWGLCARSVISHLLLAAIGGLDAKNPSSRGSGARRLPQKSIACPRSCGETLRLGACHFESGGNSARGRWARTHVSLFYRWILLPAMVRKRSDNPHALRAVPLQKLCKP